MLQSYSNSDVMNMLQSGIPYKKKKTCDLNSRINHWLKLVTFQEYQQFSLSPMRKKYPDITIQPDSMCIVGSGGGNTVSGLAAARAGNVHSLRPASPVIIELAFARVSGYRRSCKYQYHIFSVWL